MTLTEVTTQAQVSLVGSTSLYKRLNKKIKHLEVDPFFYNKQCKLFHWRWCFLKENPEYKSQKHIYQNILFFDQAIKKLDTDTAISSSEMPELYLKVSNRFMVPGLALNSFLMLSPEPRAYNEIDSDKFEFYIIKSLITFNPHSVNFINFAFRSSSIRSLKDLCMGRVVELGLAQDCLPLSVQESVKRGPELGKVDRRTKRSLEMLEEIVKELKL